MSARRASGLDWAAVLALVVLAIGLAACGKRGNLEPPKGEEKAYSYPLFYPAPDTVVPSAELQTEEEPFLEREPGDRPLSPMPSPFDDRTRSETYR